MADADQTLRFRKALDSLVYTSERAAPDASADGPPSGSPGAGPGSVAAEGRADGESSSATAKEASQKCRPWSRGDFLYRLGTFKASTWFGKPKKVGPIQCARRGWINVGIDTLQCEACKSKAIFPIPPEWTPKDADEAAEKFFDNLESSHDDVCPWVGNATAASVMQFPFLPPSEVAATYDQRCTDLAKLDHLPAVVEASLPRHLDDKSQERLGRLLAHGPVRVLGLPAPLAAARPPPGGEAFVRAQRLVALFGWVPRSLQYAVETKAGAEGGLNVTPIRPGTFGGKKSAAALQCELCGACAGLWNYRAGEEPPAALRLIATATSSGLTPPSRGLFSPPSPRTRSAISAAPGTHTVLPAFGGGAASPAVAAAPSAAAAAAAAAGTPPPSQRPSPAVASYDLSLSIAGGPSPNSGSGAGPRAVFGAGLASPPPLFGSFASPPPSARPAPPPPPLFGSPSPAAAGGKRKAGEGAGEEGAGAGAEAGAGADKRARGSGDAAGSDSSAGAGAGSAGVGVGVAGAGGLEFDPVEAHRPFCPWVNAYSGDESGEGGAAGAGPGGDGGGGGKEGRACGWRVYLEALAPEDEYVEPPTEDQAFEKSFNHQNIEPVMLVRNLLGAGSPREGP